METHINSPAPWRVADRGIVDADGTIVVAHTSLFWQSDAPRIVRAVNAHDALVSALRRIVEDARDSFLPGADWTFAMTPRELIDAAGAALKLAEGK